MEQFKYEQWWQLHLRVAQGETLQGEEQTSYHKGLLELQATEAEVEHDLVIQLKQLRMHLDERNSENVALHKKHEQLDQEIAALEVAYQTLTGQALIIDTYATH